MNYSVEVYGPCRSASWRLERRGEGAVYWNIGLDPGPGRRAARQPLLRVRNIYIRCKYSNQHLKLTQCPSCTNTWKLGSYLMNSIIFINGSNYFEFRVRIAAGITLLSLLPQTNISIPHTTRQRKMKTNVNGEFKTVWIRLKLNSHLEL